MDKKDGEWEWGLFSLLGLMFSVIIGIPLAFLLMWLLRNYSSFSSSPLLEGFIPGFFELAFMQIVIHLGVKLDEIYKERAFYKAGTVLVKILLTILLWGGIIIGLGLLMLLESK